MTQQCPSTRASGRQRVTPRRSGRPPKRPLPALPAPRAAWLGEVAVAPAPRVAQAQRDLDAGQVDTDMHATPGLDAQCRACLVPDPGGQPPLGQSAGARDPA